MYHRTRLGLDFEKLQTGEFFSGQKTQNLTYKICISEKLRRKYSNKHCVSPLRKSNAGFAVIIAVNEQQSAVDDLRGLAGLACLLKMLCSPVLGTSLFTH